MIEVNRTNDLDPRGAQALSRRCSIGCRVQVLIWPLMEFTIDGEEVSVVVVGS